MKRSLATVEAGAVIRQEAANRGEALLKVARDKRSSMEAELEKVDAELKEAEKAVQKVEKAAEASADDRREALEVETIQRLRLNEIEDALDYAASSSRLPCVAAWMRRLFWQSLWKQQ